jgi:lactate dehydrogenase-like 2-hydroxyacid dehydrogenase
MKRSAILVNTSRGPVVDELALYKALKERRIASAGLDVFEREPIEPENPLLRLDNVVLLPHIGSASRDTRIAMGDLAVENMMAALRGRIPPSLVNKELLKTKPLRG